MSYPLPLTRTEAYLAYKAGVIQQSELKPSLAVPRIGIDAWLAYWTGLTKTYPNKGHGKNLFNKNSYNIGNLYINPANVIEAQSANRLIWVECEPNTTYTVQSASSALNRVFAYTKELPTVGTTVYGRTQISAGETSATLTTGPDAKYLVYRVWHASVSTETFQEAIDSLQIEVGAEPSEYEPYTLYPLILHEEEAYIAYLCGVTDTYPEKCLRRVGAYLRYLISARWGRPDHPLNREELYLSLIKTQFIPSGDPSSDIVIDGTAKAPFMDVKMYGGTYQQTYTGKNLLEIRPSDNSRGLTIVNNARTGELTFSGTTTQGYPWLNESFLDLPAGTYTFSIDKPVDKALFLRLYNEDGEYPVTLQFTAGNTIDTKTTDYAIKRTVLLYGETTSGVTVAKQTIKPMLEAGSTKTTFEPYVGGQASPNPEYPQPIQVVTGEQVVEVQGKNLFDKNHPNNSICYVNASGVLTSGGNQHLSVYIKCEPNTTYTVSKSNKGTNNRFCVFNTEAEPAIGVSVIGTVGTRVGEDNSSSYTITTGANAHYLGVFYRAVATTPSESEIKDTIQIEKGSTATAYAPYSKQPYTINLGDIQLCGLGDDGSGNPLYEDYIYQDMDEWKVHKETANITLDNTADTSHWSKSNSTANNVYINQNIPGLAKESPLVANNLTVYNTSDIYNNNIVGICYNTTGQGLASIRIGVGLSGASTVGLFKSWLEENPVTAYYALATPTDTVITDQNLINQLNALKKGGSEEGTTYIKVSATDPNLPAKLYVEAAEYI